MNTSKRFLYWWQQTHSSVSRELSSLLLVHLDDINSHIASLTDFNDLNQLFTSIATGLEEGGYAIFSLENVSIENEKRLNKLKPDWRWQLTPSGRVAHRKEYVSLTAKAHSLETVLYEKLDAFRRENGKDVRGHMFVLQKQAHAKDEL